MINLKFAVVSIVLFMALALLGIWCSELKLKNKLMGYSLVELKAKNSYLEARLIFLGDTETASGHMRGREFAGNPEGMVRATIGCIVVDSRTKERYVKTSSTTANRGWVNIGIEKEIKTKEGVGK